MGAFGALMGILPYVGLYLQLNAALHVGHGEADNRVSGNGEWISSRRGPLVVARTLNGSGSLPDLHS